MALPRLTTGAARLEARAGGEDGSAFLVDMNLVDMNKVFERLLRTALRKALRLDHPLVPCRGPR